MKGMIVAAGADVGTGTYEASIRWTTHGVAHVEASDWGSLGFGQGWACARDHYAAICDHAVKVASQRSRHLGRGEGDRHLHSDLGYLGLGVAERAVAMASACSPEVVALVEGYAAGAASWFAEHGAAALPAWARELPWLRPVDVEDMWRIYVDMTLMASGRNLVGYVGAAVPPGAAADGVSPDGGGGSGLDALDPRNTPGSNAWAFGGDVTANGRGLVMGNPHFPWQGEGRFWECHLRLPGELDVYGVSLVGAPLVQIGFNRDVAWSHTFSRGHRFTVYSLDLVPGDPTSYRWGDEERAMTSTEVEVEVAGLNGPDGSPGSVEVVRRRMWSTHQGPMLDLPLLGWSEAMGFSYRDANLGNHRIMDHYLAMDQAASVAEVRKAFATIDGVPWANTLVADRDGDAWYVDASATPKLSAEAQAAFEERLTTDPITALAFTLRVAMLPGSDPTFEWLDDPAASQPGNEPFSALPELARRDGLFNANDPYWLASPHELLDRHPTLCGLYQSPVGARTRMNGLSVREAAERGDLDVDVVADLVLSNRGVTAELTLDGLLDRWDAALASGSLDADQADALVRAVPVLRAWDRRLDVGSVGAVVFREFLGSLPEGTVTDAGALWAEPYDPARPLDTPAGLAPVPESGPDPLVTALVAGVAVLDDLGIALDAPLGDVQFVERSGRRWPLSGGFELEGVCNVNASIGTLARADLEPTVDQGEVVPGRTERTGLHRTGYPVTYGVSFVMVAGFDDDGPVAKGLLVYGQSQDPESDHADDQLADYATKRLRPLRFHETDVAADVQESRTVSG